MRMYRNINGRFLLSVCSVFIFITIFIAWHLRISVPFESQDEIILDANSSKFAVVVVIEKESQMETFLLAQNTLACYCKIYGYKFIQIIMEKSPEMKKLCPQKHIFFQRICVPMKILQLHPEIDYVFFFDADVGVINPKHRLEEYINPGYDLSFYERIYFYDIMTGSFIAKNTKFTTDFFQDWLNLEGRFTKKIVNDALWYNDQAAIHQMFLNRYYPQDPRIEKCEKLWASGISGDRHAYYVACARSIMNDTLEFDKVIIQPKGSHKTMVRDIWLTRSEWAPRDFMFHDFEQYRITNDVEKIDNSSIWEYFPNPFLSDAIFHSTLCTKTDGLNCWKYNSTFTKNNEYIDEKLKEKADVIRSQYLEFIKKI